jgi:hypothetical protein
MRRIFDYVRLDVRVWATEGKDKPDRVPGREGLEKLASFTRRILAVPKSEIAGSLKEPIYKPRKAKTRRRPAT